MSWPDAFATVGVTLAGALAWSFTMWRLTQQATVETEDEEDEAFSVRYTLPKDADQGRAWAFNGSYICVCASAEEAIALVRAEHFDAVIYSVNHKGTELTLYHPSVLPAPGPATKGDE